LEVGKLIGEIWNSIATVKMNFMNELLTLVEL
jgi:hypothetical protein